MDFEERNLFAMMFPDPGSPGAWSSSGAEDEIEEESIIFDGSLLEDPSGIYWGAPCTKELLRKE